MATDINPKRDTQQLENEKFATNVNDKTVVRVDDEAKAGTLLNGVEFDAFSVAYPNNTTEIYSYFIGGLGGVLQATVTITYTNSSKTELASAVRT